MAAAAGGTPHPRPDQRWRTPPPNTVAAGGASGTFRGRYVVVYGSGPNMGVFVYSPIPAAGNLIASITAVAGTDPYGNAYKEGITNYSGSGFIEMFGAQLLMGIAGNTSQIVPVAGGLYIQSTPGPLVISPSAAAQLPGGSPGAAETWHAMTLASGWSNVAGFAPASYRLNALGNVELTGRITGTISGSTQFGSLPSGYYSTAYSRAYPANVDASAGITPSEIPHIRCYTTGALNVTGLANGSATVDIDGTFMLSRG